MTAGVYYVGLCPGCGETLGDADDLIEDSGEQVHHNPACVARHHGRLHTEELKKALACRKEAA